LSTPPLPQFGPGPTRLAPFQFPISETFSTGSNAGGRVGYESSAFAQQTSSARQSGHRNAHAVMTNAIYEGLGLGWPSAPHLGIGVGAVDVQDEVTASGGSTTLLGPTSSFGSAGSGTAFHDQQWAFCHQGVAGARYEITPGVAVDLDYRYLATPGLKLHTPPSSRLLGGLSYSASYATHKSSSL
jgi:opacity protein-like surface antigen